MLCFKIHSGIETHFDSSEESPMGILSELESSGVQILLKVITFMILQNKIP